MAAGVAINPGALTAMNAALMSDAQIRSLVFGGISNIYKAPHAPRGTPSKKRTGKAQERQRALMRMKYSHGNINGGHPHLSRLFR